MEQKITWDNLPWWMKVAVVMGLIDLGTYILSFLYGVLIGLSGAY